MKKKYIYYTKLYNYFFNYFCDPWDMDTYERRNERKNFLIALLNKNYEYIKPYIDYLQDYVFEDINPNKQEIKRVNRLVYILTNICNN